MKKERVCMFNPGWGLQDLSIAKQMDDVLKGAAQLDSAFMLFRKAK